MAKTTTATDPQVGDSRRGVPVGDKIFFDFVFI